ncbi:hypothetical protein MMC29_006430 [Sticta canariensis]|nr:hypothetical protein [Sticta canariensis]
MSAFGPLSVATADFSAGAGTVSASFFVCSVAGAAAGAAAVSVVATARAVDLAAADLGTATLPPLEDEEALEAAGDGEELVHQEAWHLAKLHLSHHAHDLAILHDLNASRIHVSFGRGRHLNFVVVRGVTWNTPRKLKL